ncbi:HPF/RaiA family ribosome-associated protein [Amycolatopsis sp. NPDC003865]
MQIQISTDKNVHGSEALARRLEGEFEAALSRFTDLITRLGVHVGGETAAGRTRVDRKCVLEARSTGRRTVFVSHHAGSVDEACQGAVRKLVSVLETKYDRAWHHKGGETIRHLPVTED